MVGSQFVNVLVRKTINKQALDITVAWYDALIGMENWEEGGGRGTSSLVVIIIHIYANRHDRSECTTGHSYFCIILMDEREACTFVERRGGDLQHFRCGEEHWDVTIIIFVLNNFHYPHPSLS